MFTATIVKQLERVLVEPSRVVQTIQPLFVAVTSARSRQLVAQQEH